MVKLKLKGWQLLARPKLCGAKMCVNEHVLIQCGALGWVTEDIALARSSENKISNLIPQLFINADHLCTYIRSLSVAYYIETFSYRDTIYFQYLSLCLRLGLFMSYLCDLFCHYHFHFHCN